MRLEFNSLFTRTFIPSGVLRWYLCRSGRPVIVQFSGCDVTPEPSLLSRETPNRRQSAFSGADSSFLSVAIHRAPEAALLSSSALASSSAPSVAKTTTQSSAAPLDNNKEDCLSCRIIGFGAFGGLGAHLLNTARSTPSPAGRAALSVAGVTLIGLGSARLAGYPNWDK